MRDRVPVALFRTECGEVRDLAKLLNHINQGTEGIIGLLPIINQYENCTEVLVYDTLNRVGEQGFEELFKDSQYLIKTQIDFEPHLLLAED
jgi:hypothetical protein